MMIVVENLDQGGAQRRGKYHLVRGVVIHDQPSRTGRFESDYSDTETRTSLNFVIPTDSYRIRTIFLRHSDRIPGLFGHLRTGHPSLVIIHSFVL